tara:strand:+ start:3975 stop:5105 length:1131 start_codon:yes stop_codon:yes gene_type:complete
MAYNVLKGAVEGSVDQYGDQEIDGIKIFKNTISASVFYDTDAQSPCATLKDVAIRDIKGRSKDALLIYDAPTGARSSHNLTFSDNCLAAKNVRAEYFMGSGEKLTNLQAYQLAGLIKAEQIALGPPFRDIRGSLQLMTTNGLRVGNEGLGVSLSSTSGLSVNSNNDLVIDPTRTSDIISDGQNLSDSDLLLVSDTSRGQTYNTTLSNLYESYIKNKIPHSAGSPNEIQVKGRKGFEASSNLTYDANKNLLKIQGKTQSTEVEVENSLTCRGAIIKNIKTIVSREYQVEANDYTILCDSVKSPITVNLPPACNNKGRVLVIKKTHTDKFKLNSNAVTIKVEEGDIDLRDTVAMKMNYSSRTLQSDGENWWIIGTLGS